MTSCDLFSRTIVYQKVIKMVMMLMVIQQQNGEDCDGYDDDYDGDNDDG